MKWPKVTAVIVTYNRPEMLAEALESALNQTFTDFEVLVVDDGSKTAEPVVRSFVDRFAERGIALNGMDLEKNTGYNAIPANTGIAYARGSYMAFLDDDNVWDSHHLETLVTEIEKLNCEAVYSRWRIEGTGKGERFDGIEFPYHTMTPAAAVGIQQSPQLNFIDTSSILFSKSIFVVRMGLNIFNPEIRRFGDWDMVCRSLKANLRWRGVDSVTFTYRAHDENISFTRLPNEATVGATK